MSTAFSSWSQWMLRTYYYATLPQRRAHAERQAQAGQAPIMILFYHRVADHILNDWTISNRSFVRQIRWLQANFELISLAEAQQRLRHQNHRQAAVCITFDDGYAENCERALPYLLQRRIPFTYFVSSRHVLEGQPFPHDCAAGNPLPPNTPVQLRSLAAAGVDIGAHTRTHPDLGSVHDNDEVYAEVIGCRRDLQRAIGCEISYFAFPYGLPQNLNRAVFRLARDEGYAGVCSAYGGYNRPGEDAFHLQRIHADPQFIRFKNWLTEDPRKVSSVRRYCYDE